MPVISLSITITKSGNKYPIKLNGDCVVADVCLQLRSLIPEANILDDFDHGLFVKDIDPKQSFWLDDSRLLSYYIFLDETSELEYRSKARLMTIQTLDGTRKKILVDDSKSLNELMSLICEKMGVPRHDEYGLIRPMDEEEKRAATLRKNKSLGRTAGKLEKMKLKLHTDDDLNWLEEGKTLRQLEVKDSDVLLLRRRYFYSDNVATTHDPIQLNLNYVHVKEDILNGTHLISEEQAIKLGALQLQAELGSSVTGQGKRSPIDVKQFLPQEYWKSKGIEKRIMEENAHIKGLTERESKLNYLRHCRSLPTYGITFFLVKEKSANQKKLVPRLLGISKDSVMRVDEKSKDVLEVWPYKYIRCWVSTSISFTLDLGDHYRDNKYTVKTTEGEQIAKLISGYVDVILKRQRDKEMSQIIGEENNVIIEENITKLKANVIGNVNATLPKRYQPQGVNLSHVSMMHALGQSNEGTEGNFTTESAGVAHYVGSGGNAGVSRVVTPNSQILYNRVCYGLKKIQECIEREYSPGQDIKMSEPGQHDAMLVKGNAEMLIQKSHSLYGYLGAITMGIGRIVSELRAIDSTSEQDSEFDYDLTNINSSINVVAMTVGHLMECVHDCGYMLSGIGDGSVTDMPKLIQVALSLSNACSDMLHCFFEDISNASSEELGDGKKLSKTVNRASLLEAAGRVGDAGRNLLRLLTEQRSQIHTNGQKESDEVNVHLDYTASDSMFDWEARDQLLSFTKGVANSTTEVVKNIRFGVATYENQVNQLNALLQEKDGEVNRDEIIHSIETLLVGKSNLVQTATVAGRCVSHLLTSAKITVCTMEQRESKHQLMGAIKEVSVAVENVLAAVQSIPGFRLPQLSEFNVVNASFKEKTESCVNAVRDNLDNLLHCLVADSIQAHQDPAILNLLSVGHELPSSLGNSQRLMNQANILSSTMSDFISYFEGENSSQTPALANLSADEVNLRANILNEGRNKLLDHIKECMEGDGQSDELQQSLMDVCGQMLNTVQVVCAPVIRARVTNGLESATRLTTATISPLVAVSEEVLRYCPGGTHEQQQLTNALNNLREHIIPPVSVSCMEARQRPFDVEKQTNLLSACSTLIKCLEDLLHATNTITPSIQDSGIQSALTSVAHNAQTCLNDLSLVYANSEPILSNPPPELNITNSLKKPSHDISDMVAAINTALEEMTCKFERHSNNHLPKQTELSNDLTILPLEFIKLHSDLGCYVANLSNTAMRTSEIVAKNDTQRVKEINNKFMHQIASVIETVNKMLVTLLQHPENNNLSHLAKNIFHNTREIGSAGCEFLRSPLHADTITSLTNALGELKGTLQTCVPGADACLANMNNLGRLISDLDSVVCFVHSDTTNNRNEQNKFDIKQPELLIKQQKEFHSTKENVVQTEKRIIEQMQSLIKSDFNDQASIVCFAENSYENAAELCTCVKTMANCWSTIFANSAQSVPVNSNAVEVQILKTTSSVVTSMSVLLKHGRTVAITKYALKLCCVPNNAQLTSMFESDKKTFSNTVVQVIAAISELSNLLRSMTDLIAESVNATTLAAEAQATPVTQPSSQKVQAPVSKTTESSIVTPKIKQRPVPSKRNGVQSASDQKNADVHAKLETAINSISQAFDYINSWVISDGVLLTPDNQLNTGIVSIEVPDIGELTKAAKAITQATINANNATGSGKIADILLAGDTIMDAANDLINKLHLVINDVLNDTKATNELNGSVKSNELEKMENTCKQAVGGAINTMSELKVMLQNMNKAVDTGPGSPEKMQVTLAMRRLRESVFQISESASSMSGKRDDNEVTVTSLPTSPTSPRATKELRPGKSVLENGNQMKEIHTSIRQIDIEKNIAEANETAKGTELFDFQDVVHDATTAIKESVKQISELQVQPKSTDPLDNPLPSPNSIIIQSKESDDDLEALAATGDMNAIIRGCQLVVRTTLNLISWVAAAQREMVQQGIIKQINFTLQSDDEEERQWAHGFVSAARYVASAANELVKSAYNDLAAVENNSPTTNQNNSNNQLVKFKPETLISAAKTTSSYTAQLTIACTVKMQPTSKARAGLCGAASAVKQSTEYLIKLVQIAASLECNNPKIMDYSMENVAGHTVRNVKRVIETRSIITAKEKELAALHAKLKDINQEQYEKDCKWKE